MLKKIQAKSTKLVKKIRSSEEELPLRITNETVAEHREKILAGGRKFKYPIQYAKHKLVYNAIIISVVSLAILALLGWQQLYIAQNGNIFFYNVTKVLPLPVASIDGQFVPFRDYLMKYRSAVYYLENKEQVNLSTEDGKRQADYIKQQAMNDSLADAYAVKIADKLKISVSDSELTDYINAQRQSINGQVSEQAYSSVISDYYDWSYDDYTYAMRIKLLRQKVAYQVDETATSMVNSLSPQIKATSDFKAFVENYNKTATRKLVYGDAGWVPKTNNDGGLAQAASKLSNGQVSEVIKPLSGDGYYFVLLVGSSDSQVNLRYIKIPLDTFSSNFSNLKASKVNYLISIPKGEENNG